LHGGDALLGLQPGPLALVERGARRGDGLLDVVRRGFRDGRDHFLGVRRDDLDDVVGGGGDPFAAYEQRVP